MEVRVGRTSRTLNVIIANITSECILGRDFLMATGAQLDFRNMELVLDGERIPCFSPEEPSNASAVCYRLTVARTTKIPAGHEMVVETVLPGKAYQNDTSPGLGLVQPLTHEFSPKNGLMVARSVVDTQNAVCVRMCNFGDKKQTLKEGTVVATMIPLEEAEILRETDIGRTDLVKHSIDTGNARPIKQRPRRAPRQQQAEIDRQVNLLLENDFIRPTQSPWSTPVVLVAKKGSGWRLCCDYRRLNEVTVKDAFPLPRIDDTLDNLSGAKWWCTLDLAAGIGRWS
ncbi:uncharacterized protein [Amphiura filiformis]|uniref:uncharacterized protein n=1 Tax=Amphiura filiformis TaxID=82378 RepID=UPI003B214711